MKNRGLGRQPYPLEGISAIYILLHIPSRGKNQFMKTWSEIVQNESLGKNNLVFFIFIAFGIQKFYNILKLC